MWLIYAIAAIALPVILRHIILVFLHRVAPIHRSQSSGEQMEMDRAEACKILGVAPDASDQDIKAAYSRLMQKLHPDAGGNDYFASQLNRARDILLNKQ